MALQTFHRLPPHGVIHSICVSLESALGKSRTGPAVSPALETGFWAADSHFAFRGNMASYGMVLGANQGGDWIGSVRSVLHERNKVCLMCDILKAEPGSPVLVFVLFFSCPSQEPYPDDDGTNGIFSTMVSPPMKEENLSIVSLTHCICRSLEQGEEVTFTEPHLIVGGVTVFNTMHSSHMVLFLSSLALRSLSGIAGS